jgi:hypothetical protein
MTNRLTKYEAIMSGLTFNIDPLTERAKDIGALYEDLETVLINRGSAIPTDLYLELKQIQVKRR